MILKNPTRPGHLIITPTDFSSTKKYPLVIFFHGQGERGEGYAPGLDLLLTKGIPAALQAAANTQNMVIYAGQCPANKYWPLEVIEACVAAALSLSYIDPARVVITGLSLGGGATLRYLSSSLENARKFKAAVAVCPVYWFTTAQHVVDAKLPMWFFHAADDPTVSVSSTHKSVDAILALNPQHPVTKTIYPTGGHGIWGKAYSTAALFEWINKLITPTIKADFSHSWVNRIYVKLDASPSLGALSYGWKIISRPGVYRDDFNDVMLPASANESTHVIKYMSAGVYKIQLTITGADGVQDSIIKEIVVQ